MGCSHWSYCTFSSSCRYLDCCKKRWAAWLATSSIQSRHETLTEQWLYCIAVASDAAITTNGEKMSSRHRIRSALPFCFFFRPNACLIEVWHSRMRWSREHQAGYRLGCAHSLETNWMIKRPAAPYYVFIALLRPLVKETEMFSKMRAWIWRVWP